MTIKTLIYIHNLLRWDLADKDANLKVRSAKRRAFDAEHDDQTGKWLSEHNPYIAEERIAIELERDSRCALEDFEATDWH